jgi:hypothetical protein
MRLTLARYLQQRFGWAEVTEEAIDNVVDNCDSMELGLDDRCRQAVRHATGQDKAVVFAYVAAGSLLLAFAHAPGDARICTLTSKQVSAAQD